MSTIAWEAATILAWANRDFKECQDAMDKQVREFASGSSKLVVSEIIEEEALHENSTLEILDSFFRGKNTIFIPLTTKIQNAASRIENEGNEFLRANPSPKKNRIDEFDSIHIATAMIEGVDALYTFDNGMLKLLGQEFISGLIIKKPDKVIRIK